MKRFLFWAFILLMAFFWCSTVYKTCQKVDKGAQNATTSAIDNTRDKVGINSDNDENIKDEDGDDEEDILADLIEDEEDDRSNNTAETDGEAESIADEKESDETEDEGTSEDPRRIATDDADDRTAARTSSASSNNKYMVLAGSFRSIENAKIEAKRLRKKGYTEAEIVKFDFSNFHTICVARYRDLGDARYLTKKLKREDKIEAYVHRRRSKRGQ